MAEYAADPAGAPSFAASGAFFDVALSAGNTFGGLTVRVCGVRAGQALYWWTGTGWTPVGDPAPTFEATSGCLDVTLSSHSVPTLAQLTGSPLALGTPYATGTGASGGAPEPPPPTVTGIQPDQGPAAGGTVVEVRGTGLFAPASVDFGTVAASGVTVQSGTEIRATVPPGSGTVEVRVTTPSGTSAIGAGTAFTYTVPTAQSAPTVTFRDVPAGYWAASAIGALAAKGIVSGHPDGRFRPDAHVTRAQFVKMLLLTLGLAPGGGATAFRDVPASAWYAPYVAAALRAGIVDGVSPTTFDPGGTLTREQMAVLLARALKLSRTVALRFSDDATIDAWALAGVEEAVGAGYIHGFPDGTFEPLAAATRAQAAAVLAAALRQAAS